MSHQQSYMLEIEHIMALFVEKINHRHPKSKSTRSGDDRGDPAFSETPVKYCTVQILF